MESRSRKRYSFLFVCLIIWLAGCATIDLNQRVATLETQIEALEDAGLMDEAAAVGDIFITATGMKDVIVKRHFELMKDGLHEDSPLSGQTQYSYLFSSGALCVRGFFLYFLTLDELKVNR